MSNENIRELAYEDYCAGLKYKEIADKYNVKLSTILEKEKVATKRKSCNQKYKKVATSKRRYKS